MSESIGRHLASFNLFRQSDGSLAVTIAEARGVAAELNGSGAPIALCAMTALRTALAGKHHATDPSAPALIPFGNNMVSDLTDRKFIEMVATGDVLNAYEWQRKARVIVNEHGCSNADGTVDFDRIATPATSS